MSQYIVQGIFVVAGIISLLAAVFDWEWFFTARNTQFAVKSFCVLYARKVYMHGHSMAYWESFLSECLYSSS